MRKAIQRISALLLIAILVCTVFLPTRIMAAATPVSGRPSYVSNIGWDGYGTPEEYIHREGNGKEAARMAVNSEPQMMAGAMFSTMEEPPPPGEIPISPPPGGGTTSPGADWPQHFPVDPIPSDYDENAGAEPLSYYPTYGDWVYDPVDESFAALIAYIGTDTEVVIPEEINGYSIYYLSDGLFTRTAPFVIGTIRYYIGNPHAVNVTKVTIPDTVYGVGSILFGTSVKSIYLPENVTGVNSICYGTILEEILVSQDNAYYTSVDGALFNKSEESLFEYPPMKTDVIYTLPSTVSYIDEYAFTNTSFLEAFAMESEGDGFCVRDGVLYAAGGLILIRYPAAKQGDTYVTPDDLYMIFPGAFNDTIYLEHLVLSEGVSNMIYVMRNNIKTVSLPSTVIDSGLQYHTWPDVFCQMFLLESITVSPDNPVLSSQDGILYDKEQTILYAYPMNKQGSEYIMPEGLLKVANSSFWNSRNLQKVVLPGSMISFNESPFFCDWEEFSVAEDNAVYTAVDGVLYTKDMKILVAYPTLKQDSEFTVPEGVRYINGMNPYFLSSLKLPQSLVIMGMNDRGMNVGSNFNIVGKNDYARRWASYFGVAYTDLSDNAAKGDINSDGTVNMADVLLTYQSFRGKVTLTEEQLVAADVNGDAVVNMQDVLLLYQFYRGKIGSLT